MKAIVLTGKRFGRLVVGERADNRGKIVRWRCKCDCGKEVIVPAGAMTRGHTKSCGCFRSEFVSKKFRKHGGVGNSNPTPEYRAWLAIIARCENQTDQHYPDYGGRGVSMCRKWRKSFAEFLKHVGPRPSLKHSIDRIDNDGHYEPGNVRWATPSQQAQNRRTSAYVILNGERMVAIEAARRIGISSALLYYRRKHGLQLDAPIQKNKCHRSRSLA